MSKIQYHQDRQLTEQEINLSVRNFFLFVQNPSQRLADHIHHRISVGDQRLIHKLGWHQCRHCYQVKTLDKISICKRGIIKSYCKDCCKTFTIQWQRSNPEKHQKLINEARQKYAKKIHT